jgi:phosphopantetheinyl transferase (holo-ACP synthase)
MDVEKACQDIDVDAVSPVQLAGPVYYASSACGPGDAEPLKHSLVSTLWDRLVAPDDHPLSRPCSCGSAVFPIQVARGPLGRPHLLLGGCRGPAVSFTRGGGRLWAALAGDESDMGIDAAGTDEFPSGYPIHRVFQPQELQHVLELADGDVQEASALLWSVKEAVVKALGCAFHLVDPRQITVYPLAGEATEGNGGHTFRVALSGKALARFPQAAGRSLWARSLPRKRMWLSIALWHRSPAGRE